jgi:phosphoserine phosphatase
MGTLRMLGLALLEENGRWVDRLNKMEENMESTGTNARAWTAQEFERLVLEGSPRVAVFDCDGTLWGGDAGYGFLAWSLEQGLVSRATSDWIDNRYRAYRAGQVSELEMCGEMVQIYAGLREQELRAAAERYFSQFVRRRIFPEMAALVAALTNAGVDMWAVSSTNRWVVDEGARAFGIPPERVLAAEVHVNGGVITSELKDVPTDEGKAAALRRVGLPHPDAVFGNSVHDLAMLAMARRPFPVNPSPALIEEAARRGWGYFLPAAAGQFEAAVGGE